MRTTLARALRVCERGKRRQGAPDVRYQRYWMVRGPAQGCVI